MDLKRPKHSSKSFSHDRSDKYDLMLRNARSKY